MKKLTQIVFLAAVFILLGGLAVLTLFFPQTQPNEYDPWENRNLADTPVFSKSTVFDGSFFSDAEDYLSDHLYGRTSFLRANVRYQQLTGRVSINGVIPSDDVLLLDNGFYDAGLTDPAEAAAVMVSRLSAVQDAVESYGGTFLYVGIPTQRNIYAGAYPSFVNSDMPRTEQSLAAFLPALEQAQINTLFVQDALDSVKEPISEYFSPVDHHFTLKGAHLCCTEILRYLNEQGCGIPELPSDLTFETLPNPILGTYNRKLYGLSPVSGEFQIYHTANAVPYERWDNGVPYDTPLIVLPQTETEFVQYSAYMGGDKAETILKTNRPGMKKLLIVGDSFTNAMEPLLYLCFDETRSLDFRYYTEKTLTEYVAEYQPDVVLIIRDASVYLNPDGNGNLK